MKQVVHLCPSTREGKKWMVLIDNKTIHFGGLGYSDYTKHKDPERMKRYLNRHKGMGEKWTKSGLKTAGFWSRWLLWNKPSFSASLRDMEKRFNLKIVRKSKPTKSKSKSKSRKK